MQNTWLQDLTAVRHGNASKHEEDKLRPLSEKGVAQASARASSVKDLGVELVFVSPATRTIGTAELVFPGVPQVVVPELYLPEDPTDYAACEKSFEELGYAPLSAYKTKDEIGWIGRYGRTGAAAIHRIAHEHGVSRVAIVGHAVMLNIVADEFYPQHSAVLCELQLGEAEGFHATVDELVHIKD